MAQGFPAQLNNPVIPYATPLVTDLFFFADPALGNGKKNTLSSLLSILSSFNIVQSVQVDTTGDIILPFASKVFGHFYGSTTISANAEISVTDDSTAIELHFIFQVAEVSAGVFPELEWPSNFYMGDSRWISGTKKWTALEVGIYLGKAYKTATSWYLEISTLPFI
jgi:hypothetical protein